MSAYRYTLVGRPVYVMGRAGRWWYKLDTIPTNGDQLSGPRSTRAAALDAATYELIAQRDSQTPNTETGEQQK